MYTSSSSPSSEPSVHEQGRWKIYEWVEASSTNDLARVLPPWSIARCTLQHSGRGRFNREWFGAEGGLWCSFTVPLPTSPAPAPASSANSPHPVNWGHLPLLAGLALLDMLAIHGISIARLRWPNDLLIGKSKLAGILVERPSQDMAIIGIGINITNDIASLSGKVKDTPARIADIISPCPSLRDIMYSLSKCIALRYDQFSTGGLAAIATDLEKAWLEWLSVTIFTDDETIQGVFHGINDDGSPILTLPDGTRRIVTAHTINRLIEN
ncbi:MAG: biotin--[acetyl-CoA-carboxylase] ligase [Akkermansia sp.]